MEDFYKSIDIYGIRNNVMKSIFTPTIIIDCKTFTNAHKSLLHYISNSNFKNTMIFQNEIYQSLKLPEIETIEEYNEINKFIASNDDWDIIVVGENRIEDHQLLDIDDYKYIKKLKSTTQWIMDSVYIISEQFINKIKNNKRSSCLTYVVTPHMFSNKNYDKIVSHFTIAKIANCEPRITDRFISYQWKPIQVPFLD